MPPRHLLKTQSGKNPSVLRSSGLLMRPLTQTVQLGKLEAVCNADCEHGFKWLLLPCTLARHYPSSLWLVPAWLYNDEACMSRGARA